MTICQMSEAGHCPAALRGGAVAIGNFDGVHLGHVALISVLKERAERVGGPAVAVTFDPHPIAILAPERLRPGLTTIDDRARLLHEAGADHVLILQTTKQLLRMEPQQFLDCIVGDRLRARAIVEGFNFRFGKDRAGDLRTIEEWSRRTNVEFGVVARQSMDCAVISSSRVRSALEAGDVMTAARLLGRPYRLRGVVGEGAKRGASLGFPTANLIHPKTLVVGDGVYAVRAVLADDSIWPAAANVGSNPTFGEHDRKVEVHLIGFAGDLYGQPIAIDFVSRLRDTRKFENVDTLRFQLQTDVEMARAAIRQASSGSVTVTGKVTTD